MIHLQGIKLQPPRTRFSLVQTGRNPSVIKIFLNQKRLQPSWWKCLRRIKTKASNYLTEQLHADFAWYQRVSQWEGYGRPGETAENDVMRGTLVTYRSSCKRLWGTVLKDSVEFRGRLNVNEKKIHSGSEWIRVCFVNAEIDRRIMD